jgi:glycosyltransferase involved in cell wall biosynthesis
MMFLTVIIRAYNREDTIRRCLMSVVNQTYINKIQILIINDCSTDNTIAVINDIQNLYPKVRIDIVSHNKNMGRGKALNTAKEHIIGKYCCVLDSDDFYSRNNWVEELYKELDGKEYAVMNNGNSHEMHVKNIYLSHLFKICPIPNFNYYEDHYTHWFFKSYFTCYKYNISNFISIQYDSNDRKDDTHANTKYKFFDWGLKNLYENVFYHSNDYTHSMLLEQFNKIDTSTYDDVLYETYTEVKNELYNNPFKFNKELCIDIFGQKNSVIGYKITDSYVVIGISKNASSTVGLQTLKYNTGMNIQDLSHYEYEHLGDLTVCDKVNHWMAINRYRIQVNNVKNYPDQFVVAIFRDPVERFISAYNTKCVNQYNLSFENFLQNAETLIETTTSLTSINEHIRPQYTFFNYYDVDIFVSNKDYEFWCNEHNIEVLPVNKTKNNTVVPTENQIERIKELYKFDYELIDKILSSTKLYKKY